ncbi:S-layer homology domain-containing protein [Pseudoflavonifractor phocaeensis]|uniref:S-layer homology domain-containing protein n=1 Tax=Pseudoflavonifractor phocaeensis TaxID=1870988 RepID=UPI0030B8D090
MKKRLVSILCVLALCLTLLPVTALAAGGSYLALGDSITTGYAPGNTTVSSPFAGQVQTMGDTLPSPTAPPCKLQWAFAAGTDTGKAIQLVDSGTAANIGGGQADNLYFGTYQQSSDGNGGYNTDPIKWRVLENADGQLFLLSDQNLDVFQYHTDNESVTWEESTMRSWLNGYGASENTGGDSGTDYTSDNFIGAAFSEKEQAAIADTEVVNDDNPDYGTEGGNGTTDKIFLLSIAEALSNSYFADNISRISTNTAYVAGGGKIGSSGMYGVGVADYWWLRSPGDYDNIAAIVHDSGGVGSIGGDVYFGDYAVRPAFHLDLESVLFTSAAVGGKIPAAGSGGNQGGEAADAIFEIGDYTGSEWKLTLLDNSRNFAISDAATNGSGDIIGFSYSGAQTGANEYISVVIEDNGAITHYGRILQLDGTGGASGMASLTLPADVTLGNGTKLYVYNEQYNGDYHTDYAGQLMEVVNPIVDAAAPSLSGGSATRISETAATLTFTSDEAGDYYYEVVESGETAPTIDTTGTGTSCASGANTIFLTTLSGAGAKDLYMVAKDAAGNVSDTLQIKIPEYIPPVYGISADTNVDFGTVTEGYDALAEQTVTIRNTGNQPVTLTQPVDTASFTVGALSGAELAVGQTAAFTVRPKTGLAPGTYSETLALAGQSGTYSVGTDVALRFVVEQRGGGSSGGSSSGGGGGTPTYSATVTEADHGTVTVSPKNAAKGSTVTITVAPEQGYQLDTLTVTDSQGNQLKLTGQGEGKFTFTMPGGPVTVQAVFAPIPEEPEQPLPFADISETAWYYDGVRYVYEKGLMTGTSAAAFSPDTTTSRSMVAAILWRMAGSPQVDYVMDYADVEQGQWYSEAVRWAASEGIVGGYGNGLFGTNDPITREQLAVMLYRFAQKQGYDVSVGENTNILSYTDAAQVSEWAIPALQWACGGGLITGTGDGSTLTPQGDTTRAEAAVLLMRFCEAYVTW